MGCKTNPLWVLKFGEVGGRDFFFSKSPWVGRFSNFHSKLQDFAGLDGFFGQFFVNFLSFLEAKLEFLAGLGGLFELKRHFFFFAKLQFLRGWMLFLSKKMQDFRIFLRFL